MGTTTVLILALGLTVAMVIGVTCVLWEEASVHRRASSDLKTCEEIWAASAEV